MSVQWYVGIKKQGREAFQSGGTPNLYFCPQYSAVIGPFQSVKAANYCVNHPDISCQTTQEYEDAYRQQSAFMLWYCNG